MPASEKRPSALPRAGALGALALVVFCLMALGLFGWMSQASTLLLAMAETGLSWCF